MSRKIPPLPRKYSMDGRPGSRLVITNCSSRPMSPLATRRANSAWPGSKRRLKPTCTRAPGISANAAAARAASAVSKLTGFSHNTACPARAARKVKSTCVAVGEAIKTASMWFASKISSAVDVTAAP